ncbi:MAG: zeta toxin family protein [Methylobacterium sp.]|uniref:hypothetical protein n=1 Tax=Methylobacterium sp. TaxID=409 RepID=UPI00258AF0A2|nr:hypothetical protein [Methylobacterium sp.]MBY0298530.1 zeta toxin family protein [Methylobacterium sp.]
MLREPPAAQAGGPTSDTAARYGPWNPGIESALPRAFLPLATVFRPENVATSLGEAQDLSGLCGLPLHDVVAFRAERLAVHEVLVRVTADLSVPVGEKYADLGVNFRRMTSRLLAAAVAPRLDAVADHLRALQGEGRAVMEQVLDGIFSAADPPRPARRRWFSRPAPTPSVGETLEARAARLLDAARADAVAAGREAEAAAVQALQRVVAGVIQQRGRLVRDPGLLAGLGLTLFSNGYGSQRIGRLIDPWVREAAEQEGYHRLAPQARPVVMNVKGASASGKSTMRPLQRALAGRIGAAWSDFALISPDIWRKFLLDYASLGAAWRYAGTLTGHEVEIVNKKLDRYMAAKAREGRMSHLLIDRFRFDSFAADSSAEDGSQLLTRFGDRVYMLFMITPPDATVERAWLRGEQFGRYKAVDDLLAHNVEAFTGMPRLFFTWALKDDKRVHAEFLDNSVPEGCRPRTVAFGWNGEITIFDLRPILDVDRFRKINVNAGTPQEVYPGPAQMAPARNTEFLRQCARRMRVIRFADPATGRVYARLDGGTLRCLDAALFTAALDDPETQAAFAAIAGPREVAQALAAPGEPEVLDPADTHTLGEWAGRSSATAEHPTAPSV